MSEDVKKTELVWPGKRAKVEPVKLPFQTIETINLPRAGRQEGLFQDTDSEWKNRLIWGDNFLIMGSLLDEFAGKISLIYIDPPFATGDDFSFDVSIGGEEITKEPSALEMKAYRDTWAKGLESYLQMMYDRVTLMKDLLSNEGSIYVHCDARVSPYLRVLLDEIFGKENFCNELVWKRFNFHADAKKFGSVTDRILFYVKSSDFLFNIQRRAFSDNYVESKFTQKDEKDRVFRLSDLNPPANRGPVYEFHGVKKAWRFTEEKMLQLEAEGKIYTRSKIPQLIRYLDEVDGQVVHDLWDDIPPVNPQAKERVGYPTQKPEALLERVIKASSDEGGVVADFFCGSGTTGAVAEKLGRRWVMSDLGRFAIHTTRKRLLGMGAKPFVVQNLGKYERHRWVELNGTYKDYLKFILQLYHAEPIEGFTNLHGRKGNTFVRIGAVDAPVTLSEIRETLQECKENNIKSLDVLGWEWEMGLHDLIKEEAERFGVKLTTLQIPREVMELNIKDPKIKEDIQFYELAYLDVESRVDGKKAIITLKDFIIPNPELLPQEVKDKVKNWSAFIDYWAVDWLFNQHEEESEEDDTFHNMNQEYRTRKDPKLNLFMQHEYEKPGKYNVLVKVIDIFGNDTTKLVELKV